MNLSKLNLVLLDSEELISVEGGRDKKPSYFDIWVYISDNWSEFKNGFYDGWNKQ